MQHRDFDHGFTTVQTVLLYLSEPLNQCYVNRRMHEGVMYAELI